MASEKNEHQHGDTQVLVRRLGPFWRAWVWFIRQWSLTSVLSLLATLTTCGLYLSSLRTRVVVLETQIVPDLRLAERVAKLEGAAAQLQADYEVARQHAGDTPNAEHSRKPRK